MASPAGSIDPKQARWNAYLARLKAHYDARDEYFAGLVSAGQFKDAAAARDKGNFYRGELPVAPARKDRPEGAANPREHFGAPANASFYKSKLQEIYGWDAGPADENAFMRKFVDEAKQRGVTKDQLVAVFSIETGGNTNPEIKSGNTTALGYAQFLNATTLAMIKDNAGEYARILREANKPHEADQILKMQQTLNKVNEIYRTAPPLPYELVPDERGIVNYDAKTNTRRERSPFEKFIWFANLDEQRHVDTREKRVPDGHPLEEYRNMGRAMHAIITTVPLGATIQAKYLADKVSKIEGELKTKISGAQLEAMNLLGETAGRAIVKSLVNGETNGAADVPITNFINMPGYIKNPGIQARYERPGTEDAAHVIGGTGRKVVEGFEQTIKERRALEGIKKLETFYDQSTAAPRQDAPADTTKATPAKRLGVAP